VIHVFRRLAVLTPFAYRKMTITSANVYLGKWNHFAASGSIKKKNGVLDHFFLRAIWKSLKNNEKKSKGAPFYDQPIARKSNWKLPVTSQGPTNYRTLWRHRQLSIRFPGDRLIVEGCSFGLFFIIFWALSNGSQKKMVKYPIIKPCQDQKMYDTLHVIKIHKEWYDQIWSLISNVHFVNNLYILISAGKSVANPKGSGPRNRAKYVVLVKKCIFTSTWTMCITISDKDIGSQEEITLGEARLMLGYVTTSYVKLDWIRLVQSGYRWDKFGFVQYE